MKIFYFLGRSVFWTCILGISAGIFGVAYSVARITDFYLEEGSAVKSIANLRVIPSEDAPLLKKTVTDLKNIEGITSVYPYFIPEGTVEGSVGYFGLQASYPIKLKGVPIDLGSKSVAGAFQEEWSSLASEKIPVLLPKRAIDMYNAAAPERGWPVLGQESFLGIPGLSVTIADKKFDVVIVGFDNDEIGITVSAPAEKLYDFYSDLKLNPEYAYIDLAVLDGLNKTDLAKLRQSITLAGYILETDNLESLQIRVLQRMKQWILFIGFAVLVGSIFLKFLFSIIYYRGYALRQRLLLLWGIKSSLLPVHISIALVFSLITALLAWALCFFLVVPAQQPLVQTLISFGLKVPPLELSAQSAINVGILSGILYFLTDFANLIYFYKFTLLNKKILLRK